MWVALRFKLSPVNRWRKILYGNSLVRRTLPRREKKKRRIATRWGNVKIVQDEGDENKAGYTATEAACRWAGAIFEVTRPFGQER